MSRESNLGEQAPQANTCLSLQWVDVRKTFFQIGGMLKDFFRHLVNVSVVGNFLLTHQTLPSSCIELMTNGWDLNP